MFAQQPGAGGDTVNCGGGRDTLIVDAARATASIRLFPDLGAAASTFYVRSALDNYRVDAISVERIVFSGGSANDFISTGIAGVSVDGNGGIDHWLADFSAIKKNIFFNLGATGEIIPAGVRVIRDIEQITLLTGSRHDNIAGGAQADTIGTGAGSDTVNPRTRQAADGGDFADLGAGLDTLLVDASAETQGLLVHPDAPGSTTFRVRSTSGNFLADVVNAERLAVTGGGGPDTLIGGAGTDRLTGGFGADTLTGGTGADFLSGGPGADTFNYNRVTDSVVLDFDHISGFNALDTLDLRDVDANRRAGGDQAFILIFGQAFSGVAGQLQLAGGVIRGDTNGDGFGDFQISAPFVTGADILL